MLLRLLQLSPDIFADAAAASPPITRHFDCRCASARRRQRAMPRTARKAPRLAPRAPPAPRFHFLFITSAVSFHFSPIFILRFFFDFSRRFFFHAAMMPFFAFLSIFIFITPRHASPYFDFALPPLRRFAISARCRMLARRSAATRGAAFVEDADAMPPFATYADIISSADSLFHSLCRHAGAMPTRSTHHC